MKCYRCKSELGQGGNCPACGAKVTAYKKLVFISNGYYNMGLERAKVRDLSGAVTCLQNSLRYHKYNKDARNLLGLVYFEMGELVSAMAEWVISQDLEPEDNLAAEYLKRIQDNQAWMERMNMAIRKFNQGLSMARSGDDQMAVLQLVKVIGTYKNFIKGYQLLALLYMKQGEAGKALKVLKRALSIDQTNTVCLRYMNELRNSEAYKKNIRAIKKSMKKEKEEQSSESPAEAYHEDVIIPTYRENGMVWKTALIMLAGLILGILIAWYGLMPERIKAVKQENADLVISYNSKMAMNDVEKDELNQKIDSLNEEIKNLKDELTSYTGENGVMSAYNTMLQVLNAYLGGDTQTAVDLILTVDAAQVPYEVFTQVYDSMRQVLGVQDFSKIYNAGLDAFNTRNYERAQVYLSKALELKGDSVEAMYYLGMTMEQLGDKNRANQYYNQIVQNYPNHALAADAAARLAQGQGEPSTEVP